MADLQVIRYIKWLEYYRVNLHNSCVIENRVMVESASQVVDWLVDSILSGSYT